MAKGKYSKYKIEDLEYLISGQGDKMRSALIIKEIDKSDYDFYKQFKKTISDMAKAIKAAVKNMTNVKFEALEHWKKTVTDSRKELASKKEKFSKSETMRSSHSTMTTALKLIDGRIQEYMNTVDPDKGIDGCNVADVEATKLENPIVRKAIELKKSTANKEAAPEKNIPSLDSSAPVRKAEVLKNEEVLKML